MRCLTYPSTNATSAGGDLEVAIQIFDGATGEESLHHQQDTIHKEGRGDAVDDVLDDVNPVGQEGQCITCKIHNSRLRNRRMGCRFLMDTMSRRRAESDFPDFCFGKLLQLFLLPMRATLLFRLTW